MKKDVIITSVQPTFGFGITDDTHEQVYIPHSVISRDAFEIDDICTFVINHNVRDKSGNVPWFAVAYIPDEDDDDDNFKPAPVARKIDYCDEALKVLTECGLVLTTNQIAARINKATGSDITGGALSSYLGALHQRGQIARAAVNQSPSEHNRPAYALWASNVQAFRELVE